MSALETMAANLLKALGLDPEKLKSEFETRVKQFEENIARLNAHLLQINSRLSNIEKYLGISEAANSQEVKENDGANFGNKSISGSAVPTIEGSRPTNEQPGNQPTRIDPAYNPP
jgi:vacuolar-type H+-ATPase subunit D/Vma8